MQIMGGKFETFMMSVRNNEFQDPAFLFTREYLK